MGVRFILAPSLMSSDHAPGAIGIGRISGIPIRLHFTLIFLAVFLVAGGFTGNDSAVWDGLMVVAILGSVLLHELGHALTALRFGVGISSITMYPIGGVARLMVQPRPWEELWITVAGPAVNLVLAVLAFLPASYLRGGVRNFLMQFAVINIGLLLFNLLPAFPMDGGRLLRAGLALKIDEGKATTIAANVGVGMALLMGAYALYEREYLLLFIAFMVFSGAQQEKLLRSPK